MGTAWSMLPTSMEILTEFKPTHKEVLTDDALQFVKELELRFGKKRKELLDARTKRQTEIDSGVLPDFLQETAEIRVRNWSISPVPKDLLDRRVEITGPAGDRKMVINALNSGAKCFMADLEDSNSPTWQNTIEGQINLRDAVNRTINFTNSEGKSYQLLPQVAVLMVRPRGLHLEEKHVLLEGKPISASLFDFGLYLFHNAKNLMNQNTGPYFYLPKLESHLEAQLWNEIFTFAEEYVGIPVGTIKATVLIETILSTFEADEILYELREHSAGLNCGRWDYIFSYLKKLRKHKEYLLPDRSQVTMTVPFMRSYTSYVIQTCHKRNAHAMGGMAAQIPIKEDPKANEVALTKVRMDKEREVHAGHDGTWVAHPGLVSIAMEVFDQWMNGPNQIERKREDVFVTARDLLVPPEGSITEQGLRINIHVAIRYIEAWLRGMGAVPIFHLMEDAATAEISRAQVWQWIHHPYACLEDGRKITCELVKQLIHEELEKIKVQIGDLAFLTGRYAEAVDLFRGLVTEEDFTEFLTLPGYEKL